MAKHVPAGPEDVGDVASACAYLFAATLGLLVEKRVVPLDEVIEVLDAIDERIEREEAAGPVIRSIIAEIRSALEAVGAALEQETH